MKLDSLRSELEEYIENTNKDEVYKKKLLNHFDNHRVWLALRELDLSEYMHRYFNLQGKEFNSKLSEDNYTVYDSDSSNRDAFSNVHKYIKELVNYKKQQDRMLDEYSEIEKNDLNSEILLSHDKVFNWNKIPKEKDSKDLRITSSAYKRNINVARNALIRANFLCEYDNSDRVFLRKGSIDRYYTEAHHLIPLSEHNDFEYSLDIEENVVSLCSHCHNLLHYGRHEDKKIILEKLYNQRVNVLRECGINITFEQLFNYYE